MDFYKRNSRKGKGTRPFMPVHGKKPFAHPLDDRVMTVGDDAMIEDAKGEKGEKGEKGGKGEDKARVGQDSARKTSETKQHGHRSRPEKDAGVEKELAEARAERDNYLDLARRERADFDNYRKRVEREMREIKRESLASFLKEFFGPLDDMDRVLQECEKSHSFEALATGVRIMEENFWRSLAKAGVRRVDAKGKPFDPALHEAIATVPSADAPPNTVVEVYDNGYKLDDHVLRPAKVVVSRAPDPEN